MDVIAFGSGSTLIAANCIGSVPDRSCYFDEFLRYIQRTGPNTPSWGGHTSVGTNLQPDVFDTFKELQTAKYSNTFEPSQLFPNDYVRGQSYTFHDVFNRVVNNIQACRKQLNDVGLETELGKARDAMTSVRDARIMDQAKNLITYINTRLAQSGRTWVGRVLSHNRRFFPLQRILLSPGAYPVVSHALTI